MIRSEGGVSVISQAALASVRCASSPPRPPTTSVHLGSTLSALTAGGPRTRMRPAGFISGLAGGATGRRLKSRFASSTLASSGYRHVNSRMEGRGLSQQRSVSRVFLSTEANQKTAWLSIADICSLKVALSCN